jgi:hypothetical protein
VGVVSVAPQRFVVRAPAFCDARARVGVVSVAPQRFVVRASAFRDARDCRVGVSLVSVGAFPDGNGAYARSEEGLRTWQPWRGLVTVENLRSDPVQGSTFASRVYHRHQLEPVAEL